MDFSFSREDDRFRSDVRAWLEKNKPAGRRPLDGPGRREFDLTWQKTKFTAGYGALSWPKKYGGSDLSIVKQAIWNEEVARVGAPGVESLSIALGHAGPTIMQWGTEEQKDTYLPPILRGDVIWCQGFSEPNAGSDLASLRLKAEIDGDELVLNGQKIWTSYAHFADFQETLVRTGPMEPKHQGITWLILDMRSKGVTVRPIQTMAGDQHYCEVFYNDVRVPMKNVVGEIGKGWKVAMGTLTAERNAMTARSLGDLEKIVTQLIQAARQTVGLNGQPLIEDSAIAEKLAGLRAEAQALRAMAYVAVSRVQNGEELGAEVALGHLFYGELLQKTREIGMKIYGEDTLTLSESPAGDWARSFLADRLHVIAGGTVEIRRNIIANRMLGLPKGR